MSTYRNAQLPNQGAGEETEDDDSGCFMLTALGKWIAHRTYVLNQVFTKRMQDQDIVIL